MRDQTLITGILNIDQEEPAFFFDGKNVFMAPEDALSCIIPATPVHYDVIQGITSKNRDIFFINCEYYAKQKLTFDGWFIKGINMGSNTNGFDSITFSGPAIDSFFPPSIAFELEPSAKDILKNKHPERVPALLTKPFDEYTKKYDVKLGEDQIAIELTVHVSYSLESSSRGFGMRRTIFRMSFPQKKNIADIAKYYLYAFDFFRLMVFRGNINFDQIYLWERDKEGSYKEIAEGYIRVRNEENTFKATERGVIHFQMVENHFSKLFECIVQRRTDERNDDLFIPFDNTEDRIISHSSYLNVALSFEGEYERAYPNKKSASNAVFSGVKNTCLSLLNQAKESALSSCPSKKKEKAYRSYYDNIIGNVSNIDASLEEQYNSMFKGRTYMIDIADKIRKKEHVDPIENYGNVFSKMRNKIGHGHPPDIKGEHVVVYRLARIFIYCLILESAGFNNSELQVILTHLNM